MFNNPAENTPTIWQKMFYFDWMILLVTLIICAVGIVTLYGVSDGVFNDYARPQAFRMGLGILGMFIIAFLPKRYIKFSIVPFYIFVLVLLVLTFVAGVEVNGARRWLDIGFMRLQASEFSKLAVVLMLAQFFSWIPNHRKSNIFVVGVALLIILIPTGLTFLQPDGGTAIFILVIGIFTMLIAGVSWIYYLLGIGVSFIVLIIVGLGYADYAIERHGEDEIAHVPSSLIKLYKSSVRESAQGRVVDFTYDGYDFLLNNISYKDSQYKEFLSGIDTSDYDNDRQIRKEFTMALAVPPEIQAEYVKTYAPNITEKLIFTMRNLIKDYQYKRIDVFLNPYLDPNGDGYHIIQSWITLGSGGMTGSGFMKGSQTRLNFILENHTDFIFASYAEYFGYVGTVFLLSLFTGLTLLLTFASWRNRDAYGSVVIGGISATIFSFYMSNLAMVMGIIPVVGVPLPWISYGGSVTLMLFLALGYVQNAHINRPRSESI